MKPSAADIARLRDLAEAYRDMLHLDNVVEGKAEAQQVHDQSDLMLTRAAHRLAQAVAAVLLGPP